jgi:hypothetical protein
MNLKVEWSINKEIFDGKSRSKVNRGFSKEAPWWDPAGSDRSGASNIQNLKFEPQSAREANLNTSKNLFNAILFQESSTVEEGKYF